MLKKNVKRFGRAAKIHSRKMEQNIGRLLKKIYKKLSEESKESFGNKRE